MLFLGTGLLNSVGLLTNLKVSMYFLWSIPSPDKAKGTPEEPVICMGTESGPTREISHEQGTALPRAFMLFCWEYVFSEFKHVSKDGI